MTGFCCQHFCASTRAQTSVRRDIVQWDEADQTEMSLWQWCPWWLIGEAGLIVGATVGRWTTPHPSIFYTPYPFFLLKKKEGLRELMRECSCGSACQICVKMWLLCKWMSVLTLLPVTTVELKRRWGCAESPRQVAGIRILFTASRVWNFDEERFASLDGYEEVGFVGCHQKSRCLQKPANLITNRQPPSALHPPPSWHHFWLLLPAAIASLYFAAKGTCRESFQWHSLDFFLTQYRSQRTRKHIPKKCPDEDGQRCYLGASVGLVQALFIGMDWWDRNKVRSINPFILKWRMLFLIKNKHNRSCDS